MAEDSKVEASGIDDELSVLIGDYSIPHLAELSPDSMLMQSQYAKVIFHDIADIYPTDADICCRYSLTEGITPSHGDRIALYRVGWSSVQDYLQFEWAPGPPLAKNTELQVLFKASSLPKDTTEFYQLCYVKSDNTVCGASVPFQFCHPHENDLCAVEEPGGMVVVRSRSAVADERLRQIVNTNEVLRNEIAELKLRIEDLQGNINRKCEDLQQAQTEINKLQTEKQDLEKKLEERVHLERHVARLQKELQTLDADCNQSTAKLRKAEQHIEVLTATVDTLSVDKERMVQLLRTESETKIEAMAEARQYKSQVDSLNHMLEALTQSKEMVAQELRVQQANNVQLRNDIGLLEAEAHKDKELIAVLKKEKEEMQELLEQTLNAKTSANDPEKERLLAQVVNLSTTKDASIAEATRMLESRLQEESAKYQQLTKEYEHCYHELTEKDKLLNELSQNNTCLKDQLSDLRNLLNDKEKEISEAKANYTAKEECHEDIFRKVFADIQQKIANLELEQEETTSAQNIQKDRIMSTQIRLEELDLEIAALKGELEEVTEVYESQQAELKLLQNKLSDLQARLSYIDDESWAVENPQVTEIRLEFDEKKLFVESSQMRVSDLQMKLDELEQERQVVNQQLQQAKERQQRCEERGAEILAELLEVHKHEWEIVRENSGQMQTLISQLDRALSEKSAQEVAWKTLRDELAEVHKEKDLLKQELSKNSAPNSPYKQQEDAASVSSSTQEQDLKLRLELAAVEYRKLYVEKQKLERRLTKLYQKLSEKKNAKKSSGPSSLELVDTSATEAQASGTAVSMSLSQAAGFNKKPQIPHTQEKGGSNYAFICPICSLTFPQGAYDCFTQHFDGHLS